MLEQAATDYGNPFPVSIREAQTDDAMVAIAAHLLALAKDQGFKDFLESEPDGATEMEPEEMMEPQEAEEMMEPDEITVERTEQEDDGEIEDEDREMFRRRMNR
jgi:hypothetical protein